MSKILVGVLRGGPSSEYDVSLKTGASVLSNLQEDKYTPKDIFIDKGGQWHVRGMPVEPTRALEKVDVVFNALHGVYGEDGQVQHLLDMHAVPYTGSDALGSALGMNKVRAKERAAAQGIRVPLHAIVSANEDIPKRTFELFRTFPQPVVIKPIYGGSSVGVRIATSYEALQTGLYEALSELPRVLVEECIKGREATCGIIDGFRGQDRYALPPIEIIPNHDRAFFDYEAKYAGASKEICPSTFSQEQKQEIERLAKEVHSAVGMRHYSRSDFIVTPRGIYFLEVNSLPGLTEASLVPKALDVVGSSLPEFLDHVLTLALRK